MPAPDPHALYVEDYGDGRIGLTYEKWADGNPTSRARRAKRIAGNLRCGGWRCLHCGGPVPICRRADALYCRERCRKAAARLRKKH